MRVLIVVRNITHALGIERIAPDGTRVSAYGHCTPCEVFDRVYYLPPTNDRERLFFEEFISLRVAPGGVLRELRADFFTR